MASLTTSKNKFAFDIAKQFSLASAYRGWMIVLVALALIVRAAFVWIYKWDNPSGDEAVAGLMAKHIAEGRDFPIFFYGQAYFGALEPFLNAILFLIIGFKPNIIYILPVVFSGLTVLVNYIWVKKYFGIEMAFSSAIVIALASFIYISENVLAGGGFALALFLQICAVWNYVDLYYSRVIEARKFLIFCFLSGLLFWVWQIYIPVFICLVAIWIWSKPSIPLRLFALGMFLLLAGSTPLWYYNINHSGATFVEVFGKFAATDSDKGLASLAKGFFGNRLWNARFYLVTLLESISAGNYFLLLPLCIGATIALKRTRLEMFRPGHPIPVHQLVALLAFVFLVIGHRASRYLMITPLLLLPLMFAGLNQLGRWPARIILAVVIAANLATFGLIGHAKPQPAPWNSLIPYLEQHDLHAGYSDFEGAYALTFLSAENVILSPALTTAYGERADRYPAYTAIVNHSHQTFVLVGPDSPDLSQIEDINNSSFGATKRQVLNFTAYRLYYPFAPQDELIRWIESR